MDNITDTNLPSSPELPPESSPEQFHQSPDQTQPLCPILATALKNLDLSLDRILKQEYSVIGDPNISFLQPSHSAQTLPGTTDSQSTLQAALPQMASAPTVSSSPSAATSFPPREPRANQKNSDVERRQSVRLGATQKQVDPSSTPLTNAPPVSANLASTEELLLSARTQISGTQSTLSRSVSSILFTPLTLGLLLGASLTVSVGLILWTLQYSGMVKVQPSSQSPKDSSIETAQDSKEDSNKNSNNDSNRDSNRVRSTPSQSSTSQASTSKASTSKAPSRSQEDLTVLSELPLSPPSPSPSSAPPKTVPKAKESPKPGPGNYYYVIAQTTDEKVLNSLRQYVSDAFIQSFGGQSFIQVGAYTQVQDAQQVVDELKKSGFAVQLYQP